MNYVDHTLTDQSSLLRFIEDSWGLDYFTLAPQKQSFDVVTGSFDNMFDDEPHMQRFILDPVTGSPVRDERGGY